MGKSSSSTGWQASCDERGPADAFEELRRKHQHQLRVLEAIGLSSPDFLFVFDRDQRFIYVNPSLLILWGKTLEEALGKNFAELGYSSDLVALHKGQLDEAFWGKVVSGANTYVNPDGIEGQFKYTFVPVVGEGSQAVVEVRDHGIGIAADQQASSSALPAPRTRANTAGSGSGSRSRWSMPAAGRSQCAANPGMGRRSW